MCSHEGHLDVVRLLLEKRADIEAKGKVSAVRAVHVGYSGVN
jgi:hypothetical protein